MKLRSTDKNGYGVTYKTYVCESCNNSEIDIDWRTANKKYRDSVRELSPPQRRIHEKFFRREKERLDKQDRETQKKEKKHVKRNQGK